MRGSWALIAIAVAACGGGGGGGGGDDGPPGNEPPVATNADVATDEDTPLMVTLEATGATGIEYAVQAMPTHGTVTCTGAGTCLYTPVMNFNGDDTFTFTASTPAGSSMATVGITIRAVNDPPAIAGTPATSATEDMPYTATFTSTDIDTGDSGTFAIVSGPSWLTINPSTGVLLGTPTNDDVGSSGTIIVSVTDDGGATTNAPPFTISTANTNDRPELSGSLPNTVNEDVPFTTTFTGTDVDVGDTLTYSMIGAPAWLTINPSTGVVSGTPTNANVGASPMVVITVTDSASATDTLVFSLEVENVNDAPTISPPSSTSATEDSLYSATVPAADVDVGDLKAFAIVSGPAWLSINPSTGVLSGTPANADVGSSAVTVRVTDSSNATAMTTFSISVANTNDAPVASPIVDQTLDVNGPRTVDLAPFLTDVDVGDTLTFSVTANSSAATVTTSVAGSILTLRYRAAAATSVTLTVKAQDVAGAFATETITVNLSPARYAGREDWNDYVLADGIDALSATGANCTAPAGAGYGACLHSGQIRAVPTGLAVPCSSLTAVDSLGVFQWTCRNQPVTGIAIFYSTGLVPGKGLTDLLDPSTLSWRSDQLVVTGASAFTSAPMEWWTNPIADLPAVTGTTVKLDAPGTIYVALSNPDRPIVLMEDGVALVIPPGVAVSNTPNVFSNVVTAGQGHRFQWIEGDIDDSASGTGLHIQDAMFSVVRNVHVIGNDDFGQNHSAVTIYFSSNNLISDLSTTSCRFGLEMNAGANDNTIERYVGANHDYALLLYAARNHFSGIVAVNSSTCMQLELATDNVLAGVTLANCGYGIQSTGDNNLIVDVVAANASQAGIYVGAGALSVLNAATTDAGAFGIQLFGGTLGLAGVLKVGGVEGCHVESESTSTGLFDDAGGNDATHAGVCIAESPSTFTSVRTGVTAAASFVGKASSDTVNQSASAGVAVYPASPDGFDWFGFESPYRTWGVDGNAFPDINAANTWQTGIGRIWDWRLANGDTGDGGQPAVLGAVAVPTSGNTVYTHTFSDATTATFLRSAVELVGDGIGDDDLLCESNERCLVMPNLGAYQGHGAFVAAPFTAGTLTNITLVRYATNGN